MYVTKTDFTSSLAAIADLITRAKGLDLNYDHQVAHKVVTDAVKVDTTAGLVDTTAILADTVPILADTNELQTDWTNGGRLDLILDKILAASTGTLFGYGNVTTSGTFVEVISFSGSGKLYYIAGVGNTAGELYTVIDGYTSPTFTLDETVRLFHIGNINTASNLFMMQHDAADYGYPFTPIEFRSSCSVYIKLTAGTNVTARAKISSYL